MQETGSQLNAFFWRDYKLSKSYRNIYSAGKCKDKHSVKKDYEVSLSGEGGEGEADEGDAAEVGGGQGEQAKKQLHCSHPLSSLV